MHSIHSKAARELREAGLDESQAEAVVKIVGRATNGNLATKTDITAVRDDIAAVRIDTKAEFDAMRADSKTGFDAMRADSKTGFDAIHRDYVTKLEFKAELKDLQLRLALWLGGLVITTWAIGVGIIAALIRFWS